MNLEILKKTLTFLSCLIFIDEYHNSGLKELAEDLSTGFTIMSDRSDNLNFELKHREICNMSDIVELEQGYSVQEYHYGDSVFRLGYFCIGEYDFYVINEDNLRCMKMTFDTVSHTELDLECLLSITVKEKESSTEEMNIMDTKTYIRKAMTMEESHRSNPHDVNSLDVHLFDVNSLDVHLLDVNSHTEESIKGHLLSIILSKQDCNGNQIELIGTLDKSWRIELNNTEGNKFIDEDYDVSGIQDSIDYYKTLPDEFTEKKKKSLKQMFSDFSKPYESLIEHPILEDETNIETKTNNEIQEIYKKSKHNLFENQSYLIRSLNRAHKLDFVYELPIDKKILSNYTLLKLNSSQYVSKDISKNKTNIKETERSLCVYHLNKEKKISLRNKTGLCRNCVTVNFEYFGKSRKFKYSPNKHNVTPIFTRVIDFSTCHYQKQYLTYDNSVITYVDEFYNDLGNYFRITIKRESYVLNPRIQLLIMMRYIKIIDLGKSAWDYLLLAIYLIFDEIEKMSNGWYFLKGNYLKEVKKIIHIIKNDLNHSDLVFNDDDKKESMITFCFFDTLFSSKNDSCDKLKFIEQKIKKPVIISLCKKLETFEMFSPSFLDRVFVALQETINKN